MSHHVTPCCTMSIWNAALYCISWGSSHCVMLTLNDTLYISLSCYITLHYTVLHCVRLSHCITLCHAVWHYHTTSQGECYSHHCILCGRVCREWCDRVVWETWPKAVPEDICTEGKYQTVLLYTLIFWWWYTDTLMVQFGTDHIWHSWCSDSVLRYACSHLDALEWPQYHDTDLIIFWQLMIPVADNCSPWCRVSISLVILLYSKKLTCWTQWVTSPIFSP